MVKLSTRKIGANSQKKESDSMTTKEKIIRITFIIYLVEVLVFTFVIRESLVFRTFDNRGTVLVPFREYVELLHGHNRAFWTKQIILNILLFIPLGVLLPVISDWFKKLWKVVLIGFLFSCFIEAMQYITGRGLTEIDDVINNTLGAFLGFLICVLISTKLRKTEDYERNKET